MCDPQGGWVLSFLLMCILHALMLTTAAAACRLLFYVCIWIASCRSIVLSVFQAYRVVVLPVANTWMSWSLLNKMSVTPSWGVVAVLGLILLACIVMGLQVSPVGSAPGYSHRASRVYLAAWARVFRVACRVAAVQQSRLSQDYVLRNHFPCVLQLFAG
jgi:hypothetical protein